MPFDSFIKGLIIGFSLAVPVGPIGLLCIRRTLARGRISGLVTGLGAATADGIYGTIAGFGVTFISGFLIRHNVLLRLFGGIFLCYLGIKIFFKPPAQATNDADSDGLVRDYVSTLFLTLTNPLTIFAFAAIYAAAGVTAGSYLPTGLMILGVFSGSALWWLILSGAASFFHGKMTYTGLRAINMISGTAIAAFGVVVLLSLAAIYLE